jgi:hypothetical protein
MICSAPAAYLVVSGYVTAVSLRLLGPLSSAVIFQRFLGGAVIEEIESDGFTG